MFSASSLLQRILFLHARMFTNNLMMLVRDELIFNYSPGLQGVYSLKYTLVYKLKKDLFFNRKQKESIINFRQFNHKVKISLRVTGITRNLSASFMNV